MKNLLLIIPLVAATLGMSSCCSLFGTKSCVAGHVETTKKKQVGWDIVREEVMTDAKSGQVEIRETKVPRYETYTSKARVYCPKCVRYYCPKKECCGSTSESTIRMATSQGGSGSPHIGLIPTMKPIVTD